MKKMSICLVYVLCITVFSIASLAAKKEVSLQQTQKTEKNVSTKSSSQKTVTVEKKETTKVSRETKKRVRDQQSANNVTSPKGVLIDKIMVIIYGDEGTVIITKSDLARPSIDGHDRTQEDIIIERLMYLDALKMHMVQSDDAVDAYLNTIQRENSMTKNDLEKFFAQSGYTYEEAREQLRILYAVNSIVDFKIRSRLIVPEQDVIAYYKSHPIKLQPTYKVQRAVVALPDDEAERAVFKKEVASWCQTGKGAVAPVWDEAFWVEKGELAEDKLFISHLTVGSCAISGETVEGLEVFQLVEKKDEREQPLEERYREIVEILRRPKFEELMKDYKKQLRESATVVYL